MLEAEISMFSFSELAELMARKAGKTEGHWGVYFGFALAASNVGPDNQTLSPAAIIGITQVGLQRFTEATNLTFDASTLASSEDAEAAPPPKAKRKAK